MVMVMTNDTDLTDLLNNYFEAYQNATKIMADLVAWPLSQNNLSFEQFLILRRIATADEVTLNDIAVQRKVTRSAISRQIKALLSQHYVFQVPDPTDRRRLYLHLTEGGQRVEAQVDQAITEHFEAWVKQLGVPQINQVLEMMQTITNQVAKLGEHSDTSQLHYHH
ncbi:MarR family winged helix-turn-helix transcriptional regulator [Lactiplantibacillus songbeiensis]|jgi:DNA-binding MarR family transcriptional regulator|uniref:MarR family winged helix-turn-helix transcriptional regulator n=1 Tax=Lactiplantibacillus songbeiensis TaxID=2559920 RepID=A0ABW4C315_9LACO|nr:MarR family transcriptional regulator [Lactiplantibacillus songbeiensis]